MIYLLLKKSILLPDVLGSEHLELEVILSHKFTLFLLAKQFFITKLQIKIFAF